MRSIGKYTIVTTREPSFTRRFSPKIFNKHKCFWLETDSGNTGHVLGNPDMPPETKEALRGLIDHVVKLLDGGWAPSEG